jgi:hypothetical protein
MVLLGILSLYVRDADVLILKQYIRVMKRPKQDRVSEFVIFSEDGFFIGMIRGGQPQWSMNIKEGKPFDNESKLRAVQNVVGSKELLIEYLK